jgi:hypothetical protein
MAVISVSYNEGSKNLDYKSLQLSLMDKTKKVFNSGDFVKDWFDVWKWINTNDINEPIMRSSSVDHFIMDGAPYDSGYLHIIDGKGILKYPNRVDKDWYLNSDFDGLEVFVNKGTKPTWEEYKNMYQ